MSESLNVLILNQYALPAGSAGITRHGDFGAELVRRGHDVTVIASKFNYLTRRSGGADEVRRDDGVRFIWLQTGTYAGNDSRRVRTMGRYAVAALRSAIRLRPRPDVIIGSSPHLLAALSASVIARLLRRPWVFEVRDFWPSSLVDLGAVSEGGMAHKALLHLEGSLYRLANRVVTVPPQGCRRLEELGIGPERCVHIPNAATAIVDGLTFDVENTARTGDDFVVAYIGAHGVANDLGNVIDAAMILRSSHPEESRRLRVELIGDGQQREHLARQIRELGLGRVRIRGPRPKSEIPHLLAAADVGLVHLAAADVFRYGLSPNKLFDYFAAGKPVLISSAFPTIVDESNAGIRFAPGEPAALAGAIVRMMALTPEERERMGARARELVRDRYSISRITDQYEALLEEVVQTQRR